MSAAGELDFDAAAAIAAGFVAANRGVDAEAERLLESVAPRPVAEIERLERRINAELVLVDPELARRVRGMTEPAAMHQRVRRYLVRRASSRRVVSARPTRRARAPGRPADDEPDLARPRGRLGVVEAVV
jgi:hypothetical protein